MSRQYQKLNWRSTLGAIAISVSALSIGSFSVQAAPKFTKASMELAQVGVRSRINAPTPLNLRPRTHIPLPTSSRSRDYPGYSGYRGYRRPGYHHDDYGYGHDHHHDHHHTHHRGNHGRKGAVIIINPARSSSYSNHSHQGSYIRVIRK